MSVIPTEETLEGEVCEVFKPPELLEEEIEEQEPVPEQEPEPEPEQKPTPKPKETTTYELTAYTAGPESTGKRPGDKGYGVTASGKTVQAGRTIACPPELSFGTRVIIEGLGEGVCEDRGGAIKGKRLDVYIPSLQEARKFGRQKREVTIVN